MTTSRTMNLTDLNLVQGEITPQLYSAKGDGVYVTVTASITSGAAALTATGATFTAGDVGKMISVPGAGAAGATLLTTIASFTNSTHVGLTANAGTTLSAVSTTICYGTDDATALQNAINAAVAANKTLFIPIANYTYTAPLSVAGNLTIEGARVSGNWNSGINVPQGTPPLVGSVLMPASNGSNAITITGNSQQVNISNLGILFQAPFVGTGDAINYIPTSTNQGLSGSLWQSVMVYGHDGNHYAFNLQNPIYGTFTQLSSFGGGCLNLYGNSSTGDYGNLTFVQLLGQVIVGGSANGATLAASQSSALNLITFIRPQMIINSQAGVSPAGNLPTSAQSIWSEDGNVTAIRKIAPDLETNVGASLTFGKAAAYNMPDWEGLFTDAATINLPAWTTNGVVYAPGTHTFNDTTSSGASGVTGMAAYPGTHVTATSSTTYSVLTTLYLAPPITGTNVAATRLNSLYATGAIYTTQDISTAGGAFINGTINLNKSNGAAVTEIGDGTTSGNITIGGASNSTGLHKAPVSTSFVSVAAGTTAKSSLNIASGVAPTSPNDGDIWYDGTNIKIRVGATTKTFTIA